jgi:hypothetical protein
MLPAYQFLFLALLILLALPSGNIRPTPFGMMAYAMAIILGIGRDLPL